MSGFNLLAIGAFGLLTWLFLLGVFLAFWRRED